jgi:uncharacterized membrane protein
MTRQEFIARLRAGLAGVPEAAKNDIAADYETHFTEGAAAGRSEADVAAALGDPDRLARELKAEAGLRRWEAERNPESAVAAVFAVVGLGAIDVLVLLPILVAVVSVMSAFAISVIVIFIAGAVMLAVSPFAHHGAEIGAGILMGLGMMAGSVCTGSLLTLITIGLVNGLVWYGRLHYRLLKPAIDPPRPTQPGEFATP